MEYLNSSSGIQALSTLLKDSESSKRNEESLPPISLGPTKIVQSTKGDGDKAVLGGKSIWSVDEIPSLHTVARDPCDTRPSPRFEISYKQKVGTEDTFLGINGTSPASFDCTELVIKVHFPKSIMKDIDVDITAERIMAESKFYKLFTYFPARVKAEKGTAKFDSKREMLIVTVPIDEESI